MDYQIRHVNRHREYYKPDKPSYYRPKYNRPAMRGLPQPQKLTPQEYLQGFRQIIRLVEKIKMWG